ncbi:MAG: hypothetical protein Unbinned805contig1001_35 [Prokaryotic dsDNA virus sp.]|nr:MAG: hypothetical protein Unbinned805contig1001_35 [Prokaryotic dsDNA virus sp.]|tara:strand:+ start:235 stop:1035 length:801 start_codon:yes stop_codon:yes gene_type:complete
MADKKFSQFGSVALPQGTDEIVGLSGGNNVRYNIGNIGVDDLSGKLSIGKGGTGSSVAGVSNVGGLLDEANQVIDDSLIIADDGLGNSVLSTGASVNIKPPQCQLHLPNSTGLANTDNGVDFIVPYNAVIGSTVNSDYFSVVVTGGQGTQGTIQVVNAGLYYLNARYSSYNLTQSGLPTINGSVFLRITAAVNGVKSCVLNNMVVATSINGEATVNGAQVMELNANDIVSIIGFHTGGTASGGTQAYPVAGNSFYNEPTMTLIKIG